MKLLDTSIHFKNRTWRLWLKIIYLKWRMFYMRYIKIIVWAVVEVIAELYNRMENRKEKK